MIKYFIIALFSMVISACSSPPQPVGLQENAESMDISGTFLTIPEKWTAQTGINNQNWNFNLIVYANYQQIFPDAMKIEVFYYLQHSDTIKISGSTPLNRKRIIDYLVSNGVSEKKIFENKNINVEHSNEINLNLKKETI